MRPSAACDTETMMEHERLGGVTQTPSKFPLYLVLYPRSVVTPVPIVVPIFVLDRSRNHDKPSPSLLLCSDRTFQQQGRSCRKPHRSSGTQCPQGQGRSVSRSSSEAQGCIRPPGPAHQGHRACLALVSCRGSLEKAGSLDRRETQLKRRTKWCRIRIRC